MKNQVGASKIRVVIVLALAVLVVSTVGLVLKSRYTSSHPPYRVAADLFVSAIAAHDGESSYGVLTDRLKKTVGTQSAWQQQLDSVKEKVTSHKLVSIDPVPHPEKAYPKNSDPQRLTYTVRFSSGKTYSFYVIELSEHNAWRVDEFNSTPS